MKKYLLGFLLLNVAFGYWVVNIEASRLEFILASLRDPITVGSLTPSSTFTGKAITRYINADTRQKTILEIGAGPDSGITREIILALQPDDLFVMVEINPLFCRMLHDKYGHHSNVIILEGDILSIELSQKFDYVVSSLPLTVFSTHFIKAYYEKLVLLTKSGGMISYIEYIALRQLRQMLLRGSAKKVLEEKSELIDAFKNKWFVESNRVLRNVPPTYVYHLRIN